MGEKDLSFLESFDKTRVNLGLKRVNAFLQQIGSPEKRMKYVHVAGTNGKGSVCAYLASALKEAGFRVGTYLSPHLIKFNERIQADGAQIGDRDLERLVAELREEKEKSGIDLSYFEFVTAIAFKYFTERECEYVALEVGMGGRLDATNVIIPEASAITKIGLEHKKYLGETLGEIAAEKAGIVKEGVPTVSAGQENEALEVIEKKCGALNSKLSLLGRDFSHSKHNSTLEGQGFDYSSEGTRFRNLKIKMLGSHQLENAALAVKALELLGIGEEPIRKGLAKAFLPGRFQLIHNNPAIVADVAHNPSGILALGNSLEEFFPGIKPLVVLGVSEDKDIGSIAGGIAGLAGAVICTKAKFRGMDAEKIATALKNAGFEGKIDVTPETGKAVEAAKGRREPLTVFTGSFFSVGEALGAL